MAGGKHCTRRKTCRNSNTSPPNRLVSRAVPDQQLDVGQYDVVRELRMALHEHDLHVVPPWLDVRGVEIRRQPYGAADVVYPRPEGVGRVAVVDVVADLDVSLLDPVPQDAYLIAIDPLVEPHP